MTFHVGQALFCAALLCIFRIVRTSESSRYESRVCLTSVSAFVGTQSVYGLLATAYLCEVLRKRAAKTQFPSLQGGSDPMALVAGRSVETDDRGSVQEASTAVHHWQEQAEEFLSVCCRWRAVVVATTVGRREAVVFQSAYHSLLGSLRQLLGYLYSSSRRRPTQKTLQQAQHSVGRWSN